jgi:exodeoxyribonuclease V beta subunit
MKEFKVLDRDLSLHQHYLIEASAGTGKTFSIQNIIVRLLIEPCGQEEPILLHKILVVTFTRAAARDLRIRIRLNIEQALNFLQDQQGQEHIVDQAPDYLQAILEKGEEAIKHARKRLQQALFTFDQAQIFTIHSFCARMLHQFAMESDMGLHSLSGEDPLPSMEIMANIRDFFRTEVRMEQYSPAQIEIFLKEDPHQQKLLRMMLSGYGFPSYPPFGDLHIQFSDCMLSLKKNLLLTSEKIIQDFCLQARFYRQDRGETKAETLAKMISFAKLFDQEEWSFEDLDRLILDGIIWIKALNPKLLKGEPPSPRELHYPDLSKQLETTLYPLIEEASNFGILLARMACDCQRFLRRYQQEEEKFSPDDILHKMNNALNEPLFLTQVQESYQAALIDEFQDTDPWQWEIFRRLFISEMHDWRGYLYLVGDPKQSIYSFRQADIYTYLAAAQALGMSRCFSLNVNYRSQPRLVEALNALFDPHYLPHFIPLPKKSLHLSYQPVQSPVTNQKTLFEDERGAIHFFIADGQAFIKSKISDLEEQVFFPFIAQEMTRLKMQKNISFKQFAVLVRDRHQASRLAEFFKRHHIPYLNQRGASLASSPALRSLIDLLHALLHPQDRGASRVVLGSPMLGWTYHELKARESMEFILLFIQRLRMCLFEKGFAAFFQKMLRELCRPNGPTVQEQILSREEGVEFYRDLQQIADIVIDHQYREWNAPEGIIPFLDQFKIWEQNNDERIKQFQDPTAEGVKILTLHVSKGLEFDIVFALGLANRTEYHEDLYPIESHGKILLTPLKEDCEKHRRYCEESDAEKMRQLYVSLTRAKFQLYIPVALHMSSERLKLGEASPMDLFLARFKQAPVTYEALYERIKFDKGHHLLNFLEDEGQRHFITYSIHQKVVYECSSDKEASEMKSLQAPLAVSVSSQPLFITSFSTLSQNIENQAEECLAVVTNFPRDYNNDIKDVHTLPANSETGLLIHHILQKLNFADFEHLTSEDQADSFVHPFLQKSAFKEWESPIGRLIYNTLKTPITQISDNFCLSHLEAVQFYREMPFVFPYKKEDGLEEIQFQEGLIKGVIDLIFCHEGMYYLVDWKTNWLGTQPEAYETSSMQIAMHENAYFLQAAIYSEALKRYLKLVDSRSFEQCFGGVFYLFLRGMQPNLKTGIYHFFPP